MERERLGHYQIVGRLGAGGMGQVYAARDLRLGRAVALKMLPPELLEDTHARGRLEREARALAAVSHPHIATLYALEHEDGATFLAMELVEGTTLAQRLASGPLDPDEAKRVVREAAEALQAAHEVGIIHRDLKPANVMLTRSGDVKLLDFGIARARAADPAADRETAAQTRLTAAHQIVGTVPYMSPETVRGDAADARADVWGLGCLLFECLSGVRPFERRTAADVMAAILDQEPDWNRLPAGTPAVLRAVLTRSLAKAPRDRYASATQLSRALGSATLAGMDPEAPTVATAPTTRPRRRRSVGLWAGLVVVAVALALGLWSWRGTAARARVPAIGNITRLTSLPGAETGPAFSPDGSMVAFSSTASGNRDIWVKRLDGGPPLQITDHPDTDDEPDFSPDGAWIAFHSARDGGGIFVVSPLGGDVLRLSDFGHRPRWAPDGSRLLFQLRAGTLIPNEVYVVSFPAAGPPERWLSFATEGEPYVLPEWSPDGRFVLVRYGSYAVPMRWRVIPVDGSPPVDLEWDGEFVRGGAASIMPNGSGVLLEGERLQFAPLAGDGRVASAPMPISTGGQHEPRFAADGTKVAWVTAESQSDIWRVALDPGTGLPAAEPERITADRAEDLSPLFVPGANQLVFRSWRDGGAYLYGADADGRNVRLLDRSRDWGDSGSFYGGSPDGRWIHVPADRRVLGLLPVDPSNGRLGSPHFIAGVSGTPEFMIASNWSPDSQRLLVWTPTVRDASYLLALEEPWSASPRQVRYDLDPEFMERLPHHGGGYYSPDGRWIVFPAYEQRHRPKLFLLRIGETTPRELWEGSGFPHWLADPGRVHLYSEREGTFDGQFGFVPVDPDTGERLGDFVPLRIQPSPHGYTRDLTHSMTPDRRWLYFQFVDQEGDVYVADLDWR